MADDFVADRATTGTVSVNTPAFGRIDSTGDSDWFAVTLTAGTKYRIDATGSGGLAAADTHLHGIYDGTGALLRGANFNGGIGRDARLWFEAPSTGTYYIAAGAAPGNTSQINRTYSLEVQTDWDDFSADGATTAVAVADPLLGLPQAFGEIDETNDVDWIAFDVVAGGRYQFAAIGETSTYYASGTSYLTDVQIVGLYDAGGALISGTGRGTVGATTEKLLWTAAETGRVYLAVAGQGTADEGRYRVTLARDELTADTTTPGIVVDRGAFRTRSSEIFTGGDEDWIVTPVEAGQTYLFRVQGSGLNSEVSAMDDPRLVGLYDASGALIPGTSASGTGRIAEVVYTATATGVVYAAIAGETAADAGGYDLRVTADDFSADISTTGVVPVTGSAVPGNLMSGSDVDWLRVDLTAGTSYQFQSSPSFARIDGLYDASGTALHGISGSGNTRNYTATVDGPHYLAIASADGTAGSYSVSAFRDDYAANISTAGRIVPNGSVTGTIERPTDQDWFATELQAGILYRIDHEGRPTSAGTLSDPYFRGVYSATGGFLGFANDDSGTHTNSRSYFTPVADGLHFLAAGGYGSSTGTYRLSLTELRDDFSADSSTTGRVAVGGSASGSILPTADQDWFAVTLAAGEIYRATLTGVGMVPLSYGSLALLDADGSVLPGSAYTSYASITTMQFTAPDDGTYYLRARTTYSNTEGDYRLALVHLVTVAGTAGSDWLSLPETAGSSLAAIRGGTGVDMMSFSGLAQGVWVNLQTDRAFSTGGILDFDLIMDSIEHVTGTAHDDVFYGSDRSEKLRGLGGRDIFFGSDGERDTIEGGASNDTLVYSASTEAVSVSLLRGRGWGGDAEGDRISGIENVTGSQFDDMIWGDAGNNKLSGRNGDDTITGGGGDDYILAGLGTDVIVFSGNQGEYRITRDGIRTEVEHLDDGFDGTDVIGHAEVLRFADGDLIL